LACSLSASGGAHCWTGYRSELEAERSTPAVAAGQATTNQVILAAEAVLPAGWFPAFFVVMLNMGLCAPPCGHLPPGPVVVK
jgi:hypothetical protein